MNEKHLKKLMNVPWEHKVRTNRGSSNEYFDYKWKGPGERWMKYMVKKNNLGRLWNDYSGVLQ